MPLERIFDIFMSAHVKITEIGKPFIIYRESNDVFRVESPFYLVYQDDRSRAKIL